MSALIRNAKWLIFLPIMVWLTGPMTVRANYVSDMPLEAKVTQSALVFIGTIKEVNFQDSKREKYESIALVRVDQLLKGSTSGDVKLIYDSGIPESSYSCCVLGGKYLFFLIPRDRGFMESVDGRYGVYLIDPSSTQK